MKTLMVVSGGDAPGINTALAAYTTLAGAGGNSVVGARGGFAGVLKNDIVELTATSLMPWTALAGSFLPSSREPVLAQPDAPTHLKTILHHHAIDNVVLFGGDGSLRHLPPLLEKWHVPCVSLPTTIDNNVVGTSATLGFDSACNFAYPLIDGVRATAHALPGRIFMVETLGGDCGNLALAIALGSDAHAVLLPEYLYETEWLSNRLKMAVEQHGYALLIVSEGVAASRTLAEDIPQSTGIRVRDTRLGHAQRGASPSHVDRALAVRFAQTAYQALRDGYQTGVVVTDYRNVWLNLETQPNEVPYPDRVVYEAINGL